MESNFKIAIVTNIPAPYRVFMYNAFAKKLGNNFCVFYCGHIQKDREWEVTGLDHNHCFIKDKYVLINGRHIYYDISIYSQLKKFKPDIVITNTFNPTMLLAWLYALIHRKKHVVLTDSWLLTINSLSFIHKLTRRIVFLYTHAYLAIGLKSKEFLLHYNVNKSKVYLCPLTINIEIFKNVNSIEKKYDLMFSGQFIERKMPQFFCNVVDSLIKKGRKIKVLIIGSGPLKEQFIDSLEKINADFEYPGFIQQEELPQFYASSKILLMPTLLDHWGLVANEALAAGTPVITCTNAGVANDLVIHGKTGFVLPLQEEVWVDYIEELLQNDVLYKEFKNNAEILIENYSVEVATKNFIAMIDVL